MQDGIQLVVAELAWLAGIEKANRRSPSGTYGNCDVRRIPLFVGPGHRAASPQLAEAAQRVVLRCPTGR
ncbi:MAG: hypothetical protein QM658_17650 [Gordonia sp. (in: high G+C Gram-positive bacteria)]